MLQHACTVVYLVVCAVCTGRQYKVAEVVGKIGLVGAIVPDLFVFDAEGTSFSDSSWGKVSRCFTMSRLPTITS